MTLSISVVLLLGVLVGLLWRYAGLKAWHAILCVLFGFYLASSSFGSIIDAGAHSIARVISGS